MKTARTAGALVLLAASCLLGGTGRAAENTALERGKRAQEILRELDAEAVVERDVFCEELDRGIERKAWDDWEKEMALGKMRAAFRLNEGEPPHAPNWGRSRDDLTVARDLLVSGDPDAATAPLLTWLAQRVETLGDVRNAARRDLCAAAVDYAEEIWLAARTPADLDPAIRVLQQARLSIEMSWGIVNQARGQGGTNPPRNNSRPGSLLEREAVDIYDFLSVLMSPEPFFLPDPAEHPAAFAAGHALWPDLARIGHAFTLRPAIADRHQRHAAVYQNLLLTAGRRLHELIEQNAPAAEFEPPYLQWLALTTQPPPAPQPPAYRKPGETYHIDDYRNLAARGQPRRDVGQSRPPPEAAAYRAWLTLRQAEEAADREKIRVARADLKKESATLPDSTSAYLAARDRTDAKHPPKTDEKAAPADALLARLRGFLSQENDGDSSAAKALLDAWEALRNDADARPPAEAISSLAEYWAALSMHPGSRTLFALRDRAARQLLARLYPAEAALPTSTTPLITELRERLTAALTGGSAELAGKLLALDAAGTFLPPAEHQAWARDSVILREAAALLAAGERDSARLTYTSAIRQLTEPALGEFAAHQARALGSSPKK